MATTTTRLALTKPAGTDVVDIDVLNANSDKLDAAAGATICTSTTRPASPYSGQIIYETDTGFFKTRSGSSWFLINAVQRPNICINGRFAINQRAYVSGTALSVGSYGLDRWKSNAAGSSMTFTAAPNGQPVTINSGGVFQQIVERQNIVPGTWTLSWQGTATARVYNSGSTAPAYAASPVQVTLDGTQNVVIEVTASGSTKTLDYVKLEQGELATPYEPFGGSYTSDLSACFRYYVSIGQRTVGENTNGPIGIASSHTSVQARMIITFPVPMRTSPSPSVTGVFDAGTGGVSSIGFDINSKYASMMFVNGSGFSAGGSTAVYCRGSQLGYLEFSAEL